MDLAAFEKTSAALGYSLCSKLFDKATFVLHASGALDWKRPAYPQRVRRMASQL
jgi:hypothetical protein